MEQLITSISTKCDQSLGEADMNKVAINKNTEQIECLKLKAFKNDKSFEDMEKMMRLSFGDDVRKGCELIEGENEK